MAVSHQPFNDEWAWCGAPMAESRDSGKPCGRCRKKVRSYRVAAFVEKWTRGAVEFTGKPNPGTWWAIFVGDSGSETVYREPPGARKVVWPTVWSFVGRSLRVVLLTVGAAVGIAVGVARLLSVP